MRFPFTGVICCVRSMAIGEQPELVSISMAYKTNNLYVSFEPLTEGAVQKWYLEIIFYHFVRMIYKTQVLQSAQGSLQEKSLPRNLKVHARPSSSHLSSLHTNFSMEACDHSVLFQHTGVVNP